MQIRTVNGSGQLSRFLGVLIAILVFFLYCRTPQDADMWWHLRAGQEMWQSKSVLLIDKFSFTRTGTPWVNAFWISEVIIYFAYRQAGFLGITFLVGLTGSATFYTLYRQMDGNKLVNAFVLLLAAITAAPVWGPRPQIFSFFLLALLNYRLERTQNNQRRSYWILVPIFVLWANVHGGWIWGILLLFAHLVGGTLNNLSTTSVNYVSSWKNLTGLAFWTFVAALAIGVNPNGIDLWKLPFHTVNVSMQIQEWASPDFHQVQFHPLLWILFLLIISAVVGKPKTDWSSILKLVGFTYLTFVSQRNIGPFAIIAAPILANWSNRAIENFHADYFSKFNIQSPKAFSPKTVTLLNSIVLFFIGMAAIGRAYIVSTTKAVDKGMPVNAVQWLIKNPSDGPLFNSYNWGGYLTWTLPQTPVFIDGRADLYGSELINQWWDVVRGTPQGFDVLKIWRIQTIVLEPNWPVVSLLPEAGWYEAFRDNTAVIFIKNE